MAERFDPEKYPLLQPGKYEPINRLTITGAIAHEQEGEQPQSVPIGFAFKLKTAEERYSRRCHATDEWEPLDMGWLKNVSWFAVDNLEGKSRRVNPTEEEAAAAAKMVLEFKFDGAPDEDHWKCPPGAVFYGLPNMMNKLRVRCRGGVAKFRITVFPD